MLTSVSEWNVTLFVWENLTSVSERYICTKVPGVVSRTIFLQNSPGLVGPDFFVFYFDFFFNFSFRSFFYLYFIIF